MSSLSIPHVITVQCGRGTERAVTATAIMKASVFITHIETEVCFGWFQTREKGVVVDQDMEVVAGAMRAGTGRTSEQGVSHVHGERTVNDVGATPLWSPGSVGCVASSILPPRSHHGRRTYTTAESQPTRPSLSRTQNVTWCVMGDW